MLIILFIALYRKIRQEERDRAKMTAMAEESRVSSAEQQDGKDVQSIARTYADVIASDTRNLLKLPAAVPRTIFQYFVATEGCRS